MMGGPPARYWPLPFNEGGWDHAIQRADEIFRNRMHNLVWNNCHSHVAECTAIDNGGDGSRRLSLTPWSIYWNLLWRGRPFG